jgi:hypothetical protein
MHKEESCGCGHHGEHHKEAHEESHEGRQEDCGCGHHSQHHGEPSSERQEMGYGEGCGCGGHGHHGFQGEESHHGCKCGCHRHHGGMGFRRHFIPREEIIVELEEYLKQLQMEAKGVEERIAELKEEVEPQEG